jgi:hypothetical protein
MNELIKASLDLLFAFFTSDIVIFIILVTLLIYFFRYLPFMIKYKKSSYKEASGINMIKFLFNIGYFGEGLTYIALENIPMYSKILTNLYIPTEDGTTEIDLVYITHSGVYVIESKNYSGWIYGAYKTKYWTQNIYGRKYKFLNPVWQNKKHVEYLSQALPNVKVTSLIVFSERSTLKKIDVYGGLIIKRNDLQERLLKEKSNIILTEEEINGIYDKLKIYGNKTNKEKKEHVKRLNKKVD